MGEFAPQLPQVLHAIGFSPWKKQIIRRFLNSHKVVFANDDKSIPEGATVLVWGKRNVARDNVNIVRVEDGFIRSVGLGAGLAQPLSWVFDPVGIYYDATAPSYLERLIETGAFTDDQLKRAAALRAQIVASGVTKYNTGNDAWQRPQGAARVILVPGQVESDASVQYGSPAIKTNLDLLKAVRSENPVAYIVYKPHPDVVAGLRLAGRSEDEARNYCDEVVTGGSAHQMLDAVDEVHTMTSLMGFEALLRNKDVTCYGLPFYAGWGLTKDIYPASRRRRRVSLGHLICAALIVYPRYIGKDDGLPSSAEEAVNDIVAWKGDKAPGLFAALAKFAMKFRAH